MCVFRAPCLAIRAFWGLGFFAFIGFSVSRFRFFRVWGFVLEGLMAYGLQFQGLGFSVYDAGLDMFEWTRDWELLQVAYMVKDFFF